MGTLMNLDSGNSDKQDMNDSGCVQDASMMDGYRRQVRLLDLSDDVLLYILKYCTPRDLKALGHTCPRLGALIRDRTLWTRVDARSSPIGQQRLRWMLTHCLSPSTTELKLAGYVNRNNRCLGIQELNGPAGPEPACLRDAIADAHAEHVEHFLLRMWYPHLPRYAVCPRWPDKEEAAAKAPQEDPTAVPSTSGMQNGQSSPPETNEIPEQDECLMDEAESAKCTSSQVKQRAPVGDCPMRCKNFKPEVVRPGNEKGGCKGPQFTLTAQLLRDLRLKCAHLTSLALEYCNIDYKTTNLRQFPAGLKKLSLRGTRCYNLPLNTSYLGKIQERLPNIEYLDVSECDWFEPASLMPLSKLAMLKELYMRDCKRLTECVAYASLATRYGFRQLRVIDVRGSPLADSEISALGWLPLLEELYCAPPRDIKSTEHTHTWSEANATFTELDNWETEEPEYYRITTPEPETIEDDLPEVDDSNDRHGDGLLGHPWWSHERRIIVIQPNTNRVPEELIPIQVRPDRVIGPIDPANLDPRLDILDAHIGPMGPELLPMAMQPRLQQPRAQPQHPRAPPQQPRAPPAQPEADQAGLQAQPAQSQADSVPPRAQQAHPEGPAQQMAHPTQHVAGLAQPYAGPAQPNAGPAQPNAGPGQPYAGPAQPNAGLAQPNAGPAQPIAGPAQPNAGPAQPNAGLAQPNAGPAQPNAGLSQPNAGLAQPNAGSAQTNAGPAQPNAGPAHPCAGPGLPYAGPARPYAGTAQPYARPAQPYAGPGQPYAGPALPNAGPAQPYAGPALPYAGAGQPYAGPGQPYAGPAQPYAGPAQPYAGPALPYAGAGQPYAGLGLPYACPAQPYAGPAQPYAGHVLRVPGAEPRTPPILPGPPKRPRSEEHVAEDVAKRQRLDNNAQSGQPAPAPNGEARNVPNGEPRNVPNGEPRNVPNGEPRNVPNGEPRNVPEAVPQNMRVFYQPPNFGHDMIHQAIRIPIQVQNHDPEQCPRLRNRSLNLNQPYVQFRRNNMEPVVHIDLDMQRQSTIHLGPHVGYHLVSDSAIMRFGRADNDNVNYVHIGRNGVEPGVEPGMRPDRSNLRILSVTGYRNITDRSLEHLVTAAPNLISIDFTETNVSSNGVEVFRAIRPNCRVAFSSFGRLR